MAALNIALRRASALAFCLLDVFLEANGSQAARVFSWLNLALLIMTEAHLVTRLLVPFAPRVAEHMCTQGSSTENLSLVHELFATAFRNSSLEPIYRCSEERFLHCVSFD